MIKIELEEINLAGISLKTKTTNANGQANIDCGKLWQEFKEQNYIDKIPGKLTNEILAVYYKYEGDYTQPYSYFIGCKVGAGTEIPKGLEGLAIPKATYKKITAKGKMPGAIAEAWKEIWSSNVPRAYKADFEIYDERSKDPNNAEIDIFLSIK